MRKNNFFILAALLVAGCTKKNPETLINKWVNYSNGSEVVERKLASAPQGQCLKDVFSVETLKAEIKEIEKNFSSAQKVSGSWNTHFFDWFAFCCFQIADCGFSIINRGMLNPTGRGRE